MSDFVELLESGDKEAAIKWIDEAFEKDIHSDSAAFSFANLMIESGHPGPALWVLRRLGSLYPKKSEIWQNMGRVYEEFDRPEESIAALKRALSLSPDGHGIHVNLSSAYTQAQRWDDGIKWARKALARQWDVQSAVNLGFCLLSTGQYEEGWQAYNAGIGNMKWRERHDYGLPDWNGEKDAKVLFYAEQGLGDQIAFLSCLPDAVNDGLVAGLNVAPKLKGLMADTFDVPVFGDQFNDDCQWIDSIGATHQAAISRLPEHYRKHEFPGTPYLKTDPAKVTQWRALLDELPGLKIGVAWTGGSKNSAGFRYRCMNYEDFAPLFGMDASFISLEYKGDSGGQEVHSYPWGTRGDLDHTAALISCLDAVVCVPTTAYHLAGALGVPAYVLTPDRPHFHEQIPWWSSVEFLPRKTTTMDSIQRKIHARFHRSRRPSAAGLYGVPIKHREALKDTRIDNASLAVSTAYAAAGAD